MSEWRTEDCFSDGIPKCLLCGEVMVENPNLKTIFECDGCLVWVGQSLESKIKNLGWRYEGEWRGGKRGPEIVNGKDFKECQRKWKLKSFE